MRPRFEPIPMFVIDLVAGPEEEVHQMFDSCYPDRVTGLVL